MGGQYGSQVTRGHAETEEGQIGLPTITEHPLLLPHWYKETYRATTSSRSLKRNSSTLFVSSLNLTSLLFLYSLGSQKINLCLNQYFILNNQDDLRHEHTTNIIGYPDYLLRSGYTEALYCKSLKLLGACLLAYKHLPKEQICINTQNIALVFKGVQLTPPSSNFSFFSTYLILIVFFCVSKRIFNAFSSQAIEMRSLFFCSHFCSLSSFAFLPRDLLIIHAHSQAKEEKSTIV